ncbi:MAG: secretin N-terminal domain-containing protein, partial [bacterium]
VAHQYGGYQPGYGGVQPGYGGYQPGYGGVQPGYGGVQPGYGGVQPGYGGVQPGAGGIPATGGAAGGTPWPNDPNSATAADLSGVLKGFLPKGITNVVGIPGTNSLLVQAKDEDSIKQLELLVRNLDQPIKQVTIQVQLVKMEAKEAVALGNSFSFAGVAFNLNTNNSFSGDTASSASYVNGNLRMAISALETEHRAYTVNAPSVVVQNNGTASFMMEDSVPFIYMNQTTDIYGQSYSTPTVYMQTFSQGLVVNSVTIHPDNTVTMRIEPIIEAPLGSVEIPGSSAVGGAASLMGYSRCTIDTTVTVKSGETIMMGGFTSRDDSQDDTRTPILSQLPIIGSLFFHGKNKTKSSTQVMLFVTPIIYKDDNTNLGSFAMQGTNFNM